MRWQGQESRNPTSYRDEEVGSQNNDIAHGNATLQGALSRRLGCGSNLYITVTANVREFTLLIYIILGHIGIMMAPSDAAEAAV